MRVVCSRGCADLAGQAGQANRQLPAGRRRRHARPCHCTRRVRGDQAAGRGGKSSRGERCDRCRCGRQVARRWIRVPRTLRGRITVDPFLYSNLPYDTQKDLTPVASLAIVRVFLMVHPSVSAKNLNEFLAYARANPGKLSYGSAGSGSSPHIAAEMFKRAAMIDATHVPYKGAAPALNDLLGGQVQFMFDPGPGLQHAATGKLTVLAVASAKRASRYPEVPTLGELGMRVDADTTFGVYAPAGVSAAIIERMNREITRTLNSPALVENMARLGGEVAPMTIQEFVSRQAADRARYGAFIKEAGIKVD